MPAGPLKEIRGLRRAAILPSVIRRQSGLTPATSTRASNRSSKSGVGAKCFHAGYCSRCLWVRRQGGHPTDRAPSIKVAEAAKVIENTQRDLNIAFMNEPPPSFISSTSIPATKSAAAATKWNFLDFQPGLVGGHCIGVDPYYLTFRAEKAGYHPEIILAGRRINDSMGERIARGMTCAGSSAARPSTQLSQSWA